MKKKSDLEHTQLLKIRPSTTADKNSQKKKNNKKRDPKKTKIRKRDLLESMDDSPLQSLFTPLN